MLLIFLQVNQVIKLAENNKTYKVYKMISHDKIFHLLSYPPARIILGYFMDDSTFRFYQIKELLLNKFNVGTSSLCAYVLKKLIVEGLLKIDPRTKLYFITAKGKIAYKGSQMIMKALKIDITDIDLQGKLKVVIERGNL